MLRDILLLAIIAAGALYGWRLTAGLDMWVKEEKELQKADGALAKSAPCAIVFGSWEKVYRIGRWLMDRGIEPLYMEDVCIRKEWADIDYIVALSESDTDNLSVCNLVRKLYHTDRLYSICNDKVNETVYRRFHICILNEKDAVTEQLDAIFTGNEVGIA